MLSPEISFKWNAVKAAQFPPRTATKNNCNCNCRRQNCSFYPKAKKKKQTDTDNNNLYSNQKGTTANTEFNKKKTSEKLKSTDNLQNKCTAIRWTKLCICVSAYSRVGMLFLLLLQQAYEMLLCIFHGPRTWAIAGISTLTHTACSDLRGISTAARQLTCSSYEYERVLALALALAIAIAIAFIQRALRQCLLQ